MINRDELLVIKASCLTIAQHNIFKSASIEDDIRYGDSLRKLHSTSEFVINSSTPLLFLLSLVDTFECVKKLSKSENSNQSFKTLTVLSGISLYVSQEEILVDFSELDKRVERKWDETLKDNYKKYRESLFDMKSWTSFKIESVDNHVISIKMDSSKILNS